MKLRRLVATVIFICMCFQILTQIPALSADETVKLTYRLRVDVCNFNGADCPNNKVKVHLCYRNGQKTEAWFVNCKKNDTGYACFDTTEAPWNIEKIYIENTSKNSLWMHKLYLDVKKNGAKDETYQTFATHLFGTEGDRLTGATVDKDDGGPNNKTVTLNAVRTVSNLSNFYNALNNEYFFSTTDASETNEIISGYWDGKLYDNFAALYGEYDWQRFTNGPTYKVTVSGEGANNLSVSEGALKSAADFSLTSDTGKNGFKINKGKLVKYMNDNEINMIKLKFEVTFPTSNTTEPTSFVAETKFLRDTFTIENITFSSGYVNAGENNYFYNGNSKNKKITISGNIKTTGNYSHFANEALSGKHLSFDYAYLKVGDDEIRAKSYSEIENKFNDISGVYLKDGKSFSLDFYYEDGADSLDRGLTLGFKNAKINSWQQTSGNIYKIWDEKDKQYAYENYFSSYKIDAKKPEFDVKLEDGTDISKWNKQVKLEYTPSENIYVKNSDTRSKNFVKFSLLQGQTPISIYNPLNENSASAATSWQLSAAKDSSNKVRLLLSDSAEGKFDLLLEGEDEAGNTVSQKVTGITLDNKAPEVKLTEITADSLNGKGASTGNGDNKNSKEKYFKITLSDGSGTGKLYYMFTQKSNREIDYDNYTGAEEAQSGGLTTLEDTWAFVDQADVENGTTTAVYFSVPEGKNFNGKVVYFACDAAGNKREPEYISFNLTNENTMYSVSSVSETKPSPSYKISIDTNENNTVNYRWWNYVEDENGKTKVNYITDSKRYNGTFDTSLDNKTKALNGTYYLELEIIPPSGTNNKVVANEIFTFDNEGPSIKFSMPSENSYRQSQRVTVRANDASGVSAGHASFVAPSGESVDGFEEFELMPNEWQINKTPEANNFPSGAYAVKALAVDVHGFENTAISAPFFIRNGAPEGDVSVSGEVTYNGKRLISDEKVMLDFDITELFSNASYAGDQFLYFRVGTSYGQYGEWQNAGRMKVGESGFSFKADKVEIPAISLEEGINTVYVQTAIFPEGADLSLVQLGNIKEDEIEFYFDETPPIADLVIDNVHTTESINGKLYVTDNLDSGFLVKCDSTGVKIGELNTEGYFDITFEESVKAKIYIYDAAGNETVIEQAITGIDKEAPVVSITTAEKNVGKRLDAHAEIKINDAISESVKFALIPASACDDGTIADGIIPDKYFSENLSDDIVLYVKNTRVDKGTWPGENNLVYEVDAAGTDGTWCFGVRASDSLGNSKDYVFADKPVTLEDPDVTYEYEIKPKKAEKKTVVSMTFNVPLFVLPQNKIVDIDSDVFDDEDMDVDFTGMTDAEKVKAANLELAKQYALVYSEKASFSVSDYGTYTAYAVDDLGRTYSFTVEVKEADVTFNSSSDVTAKRAKFVEGAFVDVLDDDWVCAASRFEEYYVIVEPKDPNSGTLLLPEKSLEDTIYDYDYRERHALDFDFEKSGEYAVDFENAPVSSYYDFDDIKGYKKLVYKIDQLELPDTDVVEFSDETERFLTVRVFNQENNPVTAPEQVSEQSFMISKIDNTAPKVTWETTPNVFSIDDEGYETINPTPGDVTYILNAQDSESGITDVIALGYYENGEYVKLPSDDFKNDDSEETFDINTVDSWSWDGSEHIITWYDRDGNEYTGNIPVKIEFSGTSDMYGIKTLRYTFTDEFSFGKGDFETGIFINSLGGESMVYYGTNEGSLSTEGFIYKMPIEEGEDYTIAYYYKDADNAWVKFTDTENTYYKNAKAVIELTERGQNRGLYVSNNGGSFEKVLNNYQSSFTFSFGDKYGYESEGEVSLTNFDVTPGSLEYTLSTTANTNQPVTLSVTASDDKSGVAKILLKSGSDEFPLTYVSEGVYTAEILKNGAYSIIMYDGVGNKAVKNFNIKNIDTTEPEATVVYSCGDKEWTEGEAKDFYTSRPVTATLYYSKSNVRIVSVDPVLPLTSSDYSINYSSSVITFTKSGTADVVFEDDYGNMGYALISIGNIDKTPPKLEPVIDNSDYTFARVSFNKVDDLASEMDKARKETDIFVSYGGIVKAVSDADGNKNSFEFNQNGNYTFKVYDNEGLSSYLDVTIDGIDKKAPVITKISWSYKYEEYDGEQWVEKTAEDEKIPAEGTVGYRVASDENKVTNKEVTVTVETDSETKLASGSDEYTKTKQKLYDENGMFIFNTEKKNGLISSYGVDIQVIDRTPPVIDLGENADLTFYENPSMNSTYSKEDLLNYKAYDVFNGKETDLTDKVMIDWGDFNPDDINVNKFDSSKPYTITYTVSDAAHNEASVKRTIRLVGMTDTIALVNGQVPNSAGNINVFTDTVKLSFRNFSGTAYVRYQPGVKSMAQMKKGGTMLNKTAEGEFVVSNLSNGWYTFYIQTDKRDYFTIGVFVFK